MQWELGRTRRTLLQVISESKAKMQTTSGVLSSDLSLNILYSLNSSYSSLPMLPHTGHSSQLVLNENPRHAHSVPNVAGRQIVENHDLTFGIMNHHSGKMLQG
jgi:hypothetical protein